MLPIIVAAIIATTPMAQTTQLPNGDPVISGQINLKKIDYSPPVPVSRTEPEYSERARRQHRSGTVSLLVVVDSSGRVGDVTVDQKLDPELDAQAINAVKKWTFEPARKDGFPVAVRIRIDVDFRIYDGGYSGTVLTPYLQVANWQVQLCARHPLSSNNDKSPRAAMRSACDKLLHSESVSDRSKAFDGFQAAADAGFADAQFMIGGITEFGLGLKENRVEAMKWYKIALAFGSHDAQREITRLSGKIKQKDLLKASERAQSWIAAHRGTAQAAGQ